MNKPPEGQSFKESVEAITAKRAADRQKRREIRLQESPLEKAMRLSSDEAIAMAIRDLINRDELN